MSVRTIQSLTWILIVFLNSTQLLSAQPRPTLEQLMDAREKLETTFTFSKQQYFIGESISGQVKLKNPTSETLIVPKLFTVNGDSLHIYEWDATNYRPILSGGGSGVLLDTEPYADPYPLQTLVPLQEETYNFNSLAPGVVHVPTTVPSKPGTYVLSYWGRLSPPFEVVSPTLEAFGQSLWPELFGGDPTLGVLDPISEGYRFIFSLRWQNNSSICLSIGLRDKGRESSFAGPNGINNVGEIACFAESTLPITSVSGTHDGAKNLTVSYTDSQAITRTFRVDENLNLLP
ncbi:MAG: hypothetical protein NW208_11745 [Bryobacter sp.]|nr:hypothetical protein [Bryobacter sp.]